MYRVEVASNNPDTSFKVKSGSHEFVIDTKGKGITPSDTLLASLAACIGVYIRKYCEGSKLTLDNFSITAEAEFSKEKPVGFKEINVSIDLKGAALDERRRNALLEFIKNCPIHTTLHMNPAVNAKII
jgi:putative redox protein